MSSTYLHIRHNDLENTLEIDDYYDLDTHGDLFFINREKQVVNTWITKTKSLIVFILPYYPAIGLYAYRIDNNKIKFITTSEKLPIYRDYSFFAKFESDIITSCYQPSAKNINGAIMWKLSKEDEFKKLKSVAYDCYLATDSTKFIDILRSDRDYFLRKITKIKNLDDFINKKNPQYLVVLGILFLRFF